MAVKTYRPITPSLRYAATSSFDEITKKKPEKSLVSIRKRTGGRNNRGRVTSRGRGGGHKQKYRKIDFKRRSFGVKASVVAIEYDPIRTARLALLQYTDGTKSYILAPDGLKVGAQVVSGSGSPIEVGNCLPLKEIPTAMQIHNLELTLGKGAQLVRSAGGAATVMAFDDGYAQVKLPSGEIRKIHQDCIATIGQVGNLDHSKIVLGKAGRARYLGRRPITRAVAKNPVDHPMGGGEGRTSGGGHPVTPWGVITRGYKTRAKRKTSNRFIVQRRTSKKK